MAFAISGGVALGSSCFRSLWRKIGTVWRFLEGDSQICVFAAVLSAGLRSKTVLAPLPGWPRLGCFSIEPRPAGV